MLDCPPVIIVLDTKFPTLPTSVNFGRRGWQGDSYLKNFTVEAGSGHALYVKTEGRANGATDNTDDPGRKSTVRVFAENATLVSKNKSALYLEGQWDNNAGKSHTHPDVEFEDVENVNQKLTLDGKHYSIEAKQGAYLTVCTEEVELKGGIHVSKNGHVELGYRDKDLFPDGWEDSFDTDPEKKLLDKITVTAKDQKAALEFHDGGQLNIGAKNVTISANKNAVYVKTNGDNKHSDDTVVDLYAEDTLTINGDIVIDTKQGVGSEGYVNIGAGKNVVINGNIDLKTTKENAQAVNIVLDGKGSSFTGAINTKIEESSPSTIALFASLNFAQGYLQKKKLVFTGNKGQNLPDFGLYYLNFSKNTYFRCNSPLPPRLTTSRGRSA